MNCQNSYLELEFNTVEECCKEYPENCSEKENKCSVLLPYKSYKYVNCNPEGWKQLNNDCWVDSALYALFASSDTTEIFSKILDKLNDSHDDIEKQIAYYISNYLEGLNDSTWTKKEDCKILCKNKIVELILEWNKQHNYVLNIGTTDDIIEKEFAKDSSGNIFEGPQEFLPKFFSLVGEDIINFISIDNNIINEKCKKTGRPEKPLRNVLFSTQLSNSNKPVLVISINNINSFDCQDNTRFVEIKEKNDYVLKSIVLGIGIHITSLLVCKDKVIYYDNQNKPTTRNVDIQNEPILQYADQLIFIYVKKTKQHSVSKRHSGTLKRSESLKRSKSTRNSGTLKRSESKRHSGTLKRSESKRHSGTLKRSKSTRN